MTDTTAERAASGIAAHPAATVTSDGRTLVLRRAWPRAADHLLLDYADDGSRVAGQWLADAARRRRLMRATAAAATDPGDVEALGAVVLQRRGADRRLPALAGLAGRSDTELVVHRPERRAVLRRTTADDTSWIKVVAAADPPRLQHARLQAAGIAVPHVRRTWTGPGWAAHEAATLPGAPLIGHRGSRLLSAASATGAMLRRLHRHVDPDGLAHHDIPAEVAVLQTWHARLAWVDRRLAADLADPLRQVVAKLRALPAVHTPAVLHRDLHDAQVLVTTSGQAGLLDLDTLAVGDAALDLGNLLAHLDLRAAQGRITIDAATAAAEAVLQAYGADRALRSRVAVHQRAAALRLRCVYALRPGPLGLAG